MKTYLSTTTAMLVLTIITVLIFVLGTIKSHYTEKESEEARVTFGYSSGHIHYYEVERQVVNSFTAAISLDKGSTRPMWWGKKGVRFDIESFYLQDSQGTVHHFKTKTQESRIGYYRTEAAYNDYEGDNAYVVYLKAMVPDEIKLSGGVLHAKLVLADTTSNKVLKKYVLQSRLNNMCRGSSFQELPSNAC